MSTISFCIPSKNNLRYLKTCIEYIRSNCDNKEHEILIWVDSDEDSTSRFLEGLNDPHLKYWVNKNSAPFGIGNAYNFLVDNASNKLVMMYHADMIAAAGMDTEILRHIAPRTVVSATRIEPPLHSPDPAKITHNFGLWPETDVSDGFEPSVFSSKVEEYKITYSNKITNGIFAPWLAYKEDYLAIAGHDPSLNSLAEDIDIFNRMHLSGFKFIQPWTALVYHLTCRGGQFEHAKTTADLTKKSSAWQDLSFVKTKEFIRKWGFYPQAGEHREPIVFPRYKIKLRIKNANLKMIELLEPWFDVVEVDDSALLHQYIENEQKNTSRDLKSTFNTAEESITVVVDTLTFSRTDYTIIQNLPTLISELDCNEKGTFAVNELQIHIKKIERVQLGYIPLRGTIVEKHNSLGNV
jgi:glycosyltransferase involved in cell wall biosynthesis